MTGSEIPARVVPPGDPDEMTYGDVTGRGDGPDYLVISCPGCGEASALNIRPHGLRGRPSWELTGWPDSPTLAPSVIHDCGWHGWLRDGVWRPC